MGDRQPETEALNRTPSKHSYHLTIPRARFFGNQKGRHTTKEANIVSRRTRKATNSRPCSAKGKETENQEENKQPHSTQTSVPPREPRREARKMRTETVATRRRTHHPQGENGHKATAQHQEQQRLVLQRTMAQTIFENNEICNWFQELGQPPPGHKWTSTNRPG